MPVLLLRQPAQCLYITILSVSVQPVFSPFSARFQPVFSSFPARAAIGFFRHFALRPVELAPFPGMRNMLRRPVHAHAIGTPRKYAGPGSPRLGPLLEAEAASGSRTFNASVAEGQKLS